MMCEKLRQELMEAVLSGPQAISPEAQEHLRSCAACAGELASLRETMTLLDEWQAPEPSPYFDVRLQARLREEMAKPQTDWLNWLRRPVLAAALTVLMGIGVGLLFTRSSGIYVPAEEGAIAETGPGTAVSDLQALEKNNELYSDFELLDDLDLQQDVVANP